MLLKSPTCGQVAQGLSADGEGHSRLGECVGGKVRAWHCKVLQAPALWLPGSTAQLGRLFSLCLLCFLCLSNGNSNKQTEIMNSNLQKHQAAPPALATPICHWGLTLSVCGARSNPAGWGPGKGTGS